MTRPISRELFWHQLVWSTAQNNGFDLITGKVEVAIHGLAPMSNGSRDKLDQALALLTAIADQLKFDELVIVEGAILPEGGDA